MWANTHLSHRVSGTVGYYSGDLVPHPHRNRLPWWTEPCFTGVGHQIASTFANLGMARSDAWLQCHTLQLECQAVGEGDWRNRHGQRPKIETQWRELHRRGKAIVGTCADCLEDEAVSHSRRTWTQTALYLESWMLRHGMLYDTALKFSRLLTSLRIWLPYSNLKSSLLQTNALLQSALLVVENFGGDLETPIRNGTSEPYGRSMQGLHRPIERTHWWRCSQDRRTIKSCLYCSRNLTHRHTHHL